MPEGFWLPPDVQPFTRSKNRRRIRRTLSQIKEGKEREIIVPRRGPHSQCYVRMMKWLQAQKNNIRQAKIHLFSHFFSSFFLNTKCMVYAFRSRHDEPIHTFFLMRYKVFRQIWRQFFLGRPFWIEVDTRNG